MSSEGGFTRISSLLWNWDPFVNLDPTSSRLWLCLYTSSPTKRLIPGLWEGSIASMASFSKLPADDTIRSLDLLLERDLVEYDQHAGLLRLCELPDAGEWPSNADILRSWWKRFRSAPECPVRDAHVSTIRWIIERGSRESEKNVSGKVSAKHEMVWAETFGRIKIPVSRRRGVRRLADHDTSTDVQPGLFRSETQCPPVDNSEISPSKSSDPSPSDSDPERNKIRYSNTVVPGHGEGEGVGEGDLRSSSLGDRGSTAAVQRSPAPELSDLGAVGRAERERPRLALVPEPPPYSPQEMIAALAQHAPRFNRTICDEACHVALYATIRHIAAQGVTLADLALVSAWLGRGMRTTRSLDATSSCAQDATWAGGPGNVWDALQRAREFEAERIRKTELADEARAALRF